MYKDFQIPWTICIILQETTNIPLGLTKISTNGSVTNHARGNTLNIFFFTLSPCLVGLCMFELVIYTE